MKYVSEIVSQTGEELDKYVFQAYYYAPGVRVYDTDTGLTVAYDVREVEKLKVLGYSLKAVSSSFSVVRHNRKTADLHKFVTKWSTVLGTRDLVSFGVDTCVIANGHVDVSGVKGSDTIAVNMYHDTISLGDPSASVVAWQSGMFGPIEVFTLYDTMYKLSKTCKLNLFRYKRVQFFSKREDYTSTVELEHSGVEAERYFLKVAIDVGRM